MFISLCLPFISVKTLLCLSMLIYSIFLFFSFWLLCGSLVKAYRIYNPFFLLYLLWIPQVASIFLPLLFGESFNFRFFSDYNEAENYLSTYFILLSVGLLFLTIGYLVSFSFSYPEIKGEVSNSKLSYVVYLPFLITIAIYFMVLSNVGGLISMMSSYRLGARQFVNVAGLVSQLPIGYLTVFILILNNKIKQGFIFFAIVTMLLFSVGERGAVLFSGIIPCLILYFKLKGSLSINKIVFPLVLFLISYSIVGGLRDFNSESKVSLDSKVTSALNKVEAQINAAATIKLTDNNGYALGENYINIIYAFIPRAYWPEKPVIAESGIIGMKLKNVSDSAGAGLPPGATAYAYYNFGTFGVVILMSLGGVIAGVFFNLFIKSKNDFFNIIYVKIAPLAYYFHSTEIQVKMILPIMQIILLYMLGLAIGYFSKSKV
ncbi:O-antigen polymerase [Vibrio splendidus]